MNTPHQPVATVKVECWSGNVKPYRALVHVDGRYVGRTGNCKSEWRAHEAGAELARRELARLESERK